MKFYILLCLLGALGSAVEGKVTGKHEGINPADLINAGDHTYYISPPSILEDAYKATTYCAAEGMKLVSFETEEKWMAIQDYLISNTTYGDATFWNSLEYFGGRWRWGNGEFANFFAWGDNEPNENRDGTCVRLVPSGGWFDERCNRVLAAFICEL